MNEHTSKGTLYAQTPDGFVVVADGVDITYACDVDHGTKRISLPPNLPDGCSVTCTVQGYRVTNALHRETARQRKAREAYEAEQRAAYRAQAAAPQVEPEEDNTWAIGLLTYCIWRALFGPNTPPPFPISAFGFKPQEEACSS